ncbi:GDP-L-fucose synthase family protein [Sulfitobacter sabulilitoris]|uniref:GDP-L-fucose synthase n=1 Tax=Sulfitobacter sabulilitoris TaxID=2562655 RepID=A0A5S3P7X3_9RHOB|nr:GDP-L-fucose synthase [Sulfitobacter sabulilitoris]TMM49550.1 GDP-L-fucose synthase [Sulfitobacter sabulilitoris]
MPSVEKARTRCKVAEKLVWIAGHRGLVGSAIARELRRRGCDPITADRGELDLLRQAQVETWMRKHRPEVIFIAAGKVGGIMGNSAAPADFLYENLMINANIISAAHECDVEKVVILGSSCIYPRDAAQPMAECALLTGPFEPTNEGYAVAKVAALKLGQFYARQYGRRYIGLMPTNLYGPNDNFDTVTSHVMPALVRRFAEASRTGAETVTIWGSGTPLREFLHVDDLARACVFLAEVYEGEDLMNIGSGEEISIGGLARLIAEVAGFEGEIIFDRSKPDGAPRKKIDASRLRSLGWRPRVSLRQGVSELHAHWLSRVETMSSADTHHITAAAG